MKKILITPRSLTANDHPAINRLVEEGFELVFSTPGRQPDEKALKALLPGCIGYIAGVEKISAKTLEAALDLRVISRNGTGIDNIDLKAAKRFNIKILRAEGANARGVAELTLALMLASVRSICFSDAQLKRGDWRRRKGLELQDRTLGLVGCGKIGRIVAQMTLGIGMHVIAYDTFPDATFSPSPHFRYVTLEELLTTSDVVSFHCPLSKERKAILDRQTIKKLKHGVYLINTARAGLIDEDAVFEGLDDGCIAGYATDVYNKEPPEISPILSHDHVIVTPHIGAYTEESILRATRDAVENLIAYLRATLK